MREVRRQREEGVNEMRLQETRRIRRGDREREEGETGEQLAEESEGERAKGERAARSWKM